MEYMPLIFSATSVIFCILTFAVNRKDKAIQNTKENNLSLINFRLDQLDKNVQRILDKLDAYDKEVEDKIEKAISAHVEAYHKRGRKTQ